MADDSQISPNYLIAIIVSIIVILLILGFFLVKIIQSIPN